jgi:hypothetical protein
MPEASLAADAERDGVAASIAAFEQAWMPSGHLLSVEHRVVSDRKATDRWILRFKGTEKDVIAIWLSLGQRTLSLEAEVMPAPEVNSEAIHALVLRRNAALFGIAFAIGPESGIYLVARVPASVVDIDEIDRLCGSTIEALEAVYPTVMSLGFPGQFRRRRVSQTPLR